MAQSWLASNYHYDRACALGLSFRDYIAEKLAVKRRQFNTLLNNPDLEKERKAAEMKAQADAYRRAKEYSGG